ncbi:MAG: ABC transporter ATP-binding protein [Anaerolineae bacterium]|nr:ABC transporter ATP-binding protein [Anaerolineae bacterium]
MDREVDPAIFPQTTHAAEGGHSVLRMEQVTKRFGDVVAVDDLTLDVYEGEIFGFLGPNGAGKTTSINMMCGLLKADAGLVTIHGQPVHDGDPDLSPRVGVCPQDIVLWGELTCREQLVFIGEMYGVPRKTACQRADRLLADMGLAEKRHKLARTLSGGMQRRLNLIMALVHDPDIIVLDEPEAGLDPQGRVLVRDYIRSLARQKTVILTTHNMDEADRVADRVAIIDHGHLLTVDTPAALKHRIGEGDVLEITLVSDAAGEQLDVLCERAAAAVRHITPEVSLTASTLIIRARGIVDLLPDILNALKTAGVPTGEVRLRENTLEDVFIALTGRGLRE